MGETLEIAIRSLAAGGDGVGRAPDGRVVFVPLCAPGDRVRVRVVEARRRFARAEALELLAPGPDRIEPACDVFGACGGCAWQHVAYPAQLEAKRAILSDALTRIGHLETPDRLEMTPSPSPYGYRTRARVVAESGRVGYRRRRSRDLCATERCPVLAPPLEEALMRLASGGGKPAGGREGRREEWELALGDEGARAVRLPARRGPGLTLRVGGQALRVSPGVFAQANTGLLDALASSVCEAAGRGRVALELFAGVGTFTLGLARRFARVTAVESSAAAVRDLRANARAAALANVDVVHGRVEDALAGGAFANDGPEAVVLDPPRTGLSAGAVHALAALAPRRIAYLSCEPATLARDCAALVSRGYRVAGVRGFDLFPQTPHVEALVRLECA